MILKLVIFVVITIDALTSVLSKQSVIRKLIEFSHIHQQ